MGVVTGGLRQRRPPSRCQGRRGGVVALVRVRHSTSRTDGTSRGKHDWVHALWQPCSFLTISCLQIPEYFTMLWKKKNVWFASLR